MSVIGIIGIAVALLLLGLMALGPLLVELNDRLPARPRQRTAERSCSAAASSTAAMA
ncbi:hypothetical protein [Amycolatopsis suaedae]|uniref:hypothetical protein n=1 Tax=Amycolatopsis suaedae TaxID=2510978 RepID=UPI0013EF29E2|nr:hypothetical protein [Amycolatopsis suaedae]